jgi:hypothetical protein
MSCILYYSNYCSHSQKLLKSLSKTNLSNEIHFISIDNRIKKEDGNVYIQLQDKQMILPKNIVKVPALLLLNKNYQVLFGENIYNYFKPKENEVNVKATMNNLEPMAFSFGGGSAIVSDNYSFLDMDSDQLSAKGNGGLRQMHSYFSLNNSNEQIQTPSEDTNVQSKPKSESISLEQLQKQREIELK